MLKNYFLIAIRSFKRDRTNALISLAGLIVGLTCVMLIVGYIRYETSFDRSYGNADRIYRVISTNKKFNEGRSETVPIPFAPTLVREAPEISAQTRISVYPDKALIQNQFTNLENAEVDSSFFSVFNLRFINGDSRTALNSKDKIVLTASAAKRLYNTTDVIGKSFVMEDQPVIISGVVEDMAQNSFLQTEAFHFRPFSKHTLTLDVSSGGNYGMDNAFILLNKNVSVANAEKKIKQFNHKYKVDDYFEMELQPVQKIHLYSTDIKGVFSPFNVGDIKYVYVYGAIGLLILLIGCINFINLSVARSIERAKEIGVRKVLGAQKKQLVVQFISESALYYAISIPIALLFACIFWKGFTALLNIDASIPFLLNVQTLLIIIVVCVVATLLSSLYPAFFLSRLQPVNTLKGVQLTGLKLNLGLRKTLIVFQFTVSIVLIAATIIIHGQLKYLNNMPLGFNKNNLVGFEIPFLKQMPRAFKDKLLQNPNINAVTFASVNIGKSYGMSGVMKDSSGTDSTKFLKYNIINADIDFIKTIQAPIVAGRCFSSDFPADMVDYDSLAGWTGADPKRSLIVSQSLIKQLAIKDPIGKVISNKDIFLQGTIIGVFGNFNLMSLRDTAPILAIRYKPSGTYLPRAYARINAANIQSTINYISRTFKQFFPKDKFDFSFVDDRIAHLYDAETRLTKLFNIFAFLAIVLSCAGLFSLVSLMVRKRTKEIGIRKVLGASVKDIVMLISKDFLWLIIISFIIATPLAYIAMNKWLQGYANKTKIYWWIFAIAGIAAFVIAFASIGFKSVSAAKANPVDSLRDE